MSKPLFASKWYKEAPANELRQEVQNLYRLVEGAGVDPALLTDVENLEAGLLDLEAALDDYLPLTGGTLTGGLQVSPSGEVLTLDLEQAGNNVQYGMRLRSPYVHGRLWAGTGGFVIDAQDSSGGARNLHLRTGGEDRIHISTTGEITLGNQATATTHAVRADRSVSAGNGLTGGGNLTANRSIALGTPGTITTSTSNSVTTSSHTHALTLPESYGAVGTYVLGYIENTAVGQGSSYAGSSIEPAGFLNVSITSIADDASTAAELTKGSSALSGTWRAMGRVARLNGTSRPRVTLFLRIS